MLWMTLPIGVLRRGRVQSDFHSLDRRHEPSSTAHYQIHSKLVLVAQYDTRHHRFCSFVRHLPIVQDCQRATSGTTPHAPNPWDSVAMDFIGPSPLSNGFDYLMVVICRLTSIMVHLLPTATTTTSSDIAALHYKDVVRLHGLPQSIVSDRDSKFTALFWRDLHRLMGTRLLMSTAYHPQTDGAQILRTRIKSDQSDWSDRIPMAEFAINSAVSSATGFAPFDLNYGTVPTLLLLPRETGLSEYPGVAQWLPSMYASHMTQFLLLVSRKHSGLIGKDAPTADTLWVTRPISRQKICGYTIFRGPALIE